MKWFKKKPLVSSHTKFKISLKGRLRMSSLAFIKGKWTHLMGRSQVWPIAKVALPEEGHCALTGFGAPGLEDYSQLSLWPVQDSKDVKDLCCHCQVQEWHQSSALREVSNPCVGASRDWRCQRALDWAGSWWGTAGDRAVTLPCLGCLKIYEEILVCR